MEGDPGSLPLVNLFHTLREAGLPLGIDDYLALVQALQKGFGLPDRHSLARLCHTLWVKSPEDAALLDYHFVRIFKSSERDEGGPLHQGQSQEFQPEEYRATGGGRGDAATKPYLMPIQLPPRGGSSLRVGLVPDYLPISQRQMKQIWRHLNKPRRQGLATELDVEATIRRIGMMGSFDELVLVPPRSNRMSLVLLIDQGGSMAPFEPLTQRIVETAVRGGRIGSLETYYFRNCPIGYLYRDPFHQEAVPQSLVLEELRRRQTRLLIVSDAGAARGSISTLRITQTDSFLEQVHQYVRYLAWLNPLPRKRWPNTSAQSISALVPMFPCTRRGFDSAINVLRGRADLM